MEPCCRCNINTVIFVSSGIYSCLYIDGALIRYFCFTGIAAGYESNDPFHVLVLIGAGIRDAVFLFLPATLLLFPGTFQSSGIYSCLYIDGALIRYFCFTGIAAG